MDKTLAPRIGPLPRPNRNRACEVSEDVTLWLTAPPLPKPPQPQRWSGIVFMAFARPSLAASVQVVVRAQSLDDLVYFGLGLGNVRRAPFIDHSVSSEGVPLQAHNNYRMVLKDDGLEIEIGSAGVQHGSDANRSLGLGDR